MREVKGIGRIVYPVPTNPLPFRFTLIGLTIPQIRPNESFTLKKHPKIRQKDASHRISPSYNQIISMTSATQLPSFCGDCMNGTHFISLLVNATAVTLCQGHGKVIQNTSPDLYILWSKCLRCSVNGFGVRGKTRCAGGGGGENELKTLSHPRTGWPNDI